VCLLSSFYVDYKKPFNHYHFLHPRSSYSLLFTSFQQVGEFSDPNGVVLKNGQLFRLDLDEALGDSTRVLLPHPEIIEASEVGHVLLVDDGKVKLVVSGALHNFLLRMISFCSPNLICIQSVVIVHRQGTRIP
jgi:hypothetical protein